MAILHTHALLSSIALLRFVDAVRVSVSESEALHGLQQSASGGQLRLFATSFNGANHKFTADETTNLLRTLTLGHDEPGREADIVFLGFQEFAEASHVSLANIASKRTLWQGLSARAGQQFGEELRRKATAPASAHGHKAQLAGHLAEFHGRLGAEVHSFTQRYGPNDDDFHRHLVEHSLTKRLQEQGRLLDQQVETGISEVLRNVEEYKTDVSDHKFDNLRREAGNLADVARSYDASQIANMLGPIREWTTSAMAELGEVRRRYPNMVLNAEGQTAMQAFLSSVNNVDFLQTNLLDQRNEDLVTDSISGFHSKLSEQVEQAETELSQTLQQDLTALRQAAAHLLDDITHAEGRQRQSIANAAAEGAEERQAQIRASTELWATHSRETLAPLLQPASIDLTADHLDVQSKGEIWNSGWRCHSGSHYDTALFAFINPWSSWSVSQVDYSSPNCRKSVGSFGCTIDNDVGWECGKVVNMQIFDAEKDGETIRTCSLNTHMSFANTASDRMRSIQTAVAEAGAANCDSAVFVGDFNSRLHCRVPGDGQGDDAPPFMRLDPATNSSLKYLMDTFCTGSRCTIGGPNRHWDELTQMLEATALDCYEEDSTEGWTPVSIENTIPATGVREAAPVDFAPTYKVSSPEGALGHGHWARCLGDEPTCFVNGDSKGKHNPSWTDRVLLKSSERVSLATTEYSRRPVPASFHSDHVPVVAQLTVELV